MTVGAAEEHRFGIRAAHEMGLSVFVTDGNSDSPGFKDAEAFAVASTYDHQSTMAVAKDYIANGGRIDGVMTLAADVPFTVAHVAEGLGLPGIGTESARNASEKIRMKNCFRNNAVPMPLFEEVSDRKQLGEVTKEFGLPVVIKPVDSRGGRGVQLIRDQAQLVTAYALAHGHSPTGRVMVEQYLSGPQLSTEGFMLDGEAYIPAIFDRNYEYLERFAPFIVENGGEMPSIYSRRYEQEINEIMKRAALALGITTGIIKGDLVIHDEQVKVIEIAARLSGGFFGTVATPVSCGVDLVQLNIQLVLRGSIDPDDLIHKYSKAAAIRFAFPQPGRMTKVSGIDHVLNDPACRYAHVFKRENDILEPITHHPARPAVVVAEGSDLDEAVKQAQRLIETLQWEIEPA